MDDNEFRKYEKMYIDSTFNAITSLIPGQKEELDLMQENLKIWGFDRELPNICITANNKIVQLAHEFEEVGLSLYARKSDKYKVSVYGSFIGESIILDLISKLADSSAILKEYSELSFKLSKQRTEKIANYANKKFKNVRRLFSKKNQLDLSLSDDDYNKLYALIQKYEDLNSEIYNYNLKDNIVRALVENIAGPDKYGHKHHYDKTIVPGLLDEEVIPFMKQLGLGGLLPKLHEKLKEEYKDDEFSVYDSPEVLNFFGGPTISNETVNNADVAVVNEDVVSVGGRSR